MHFYNEVFEHHVKGRYWNKCCYIVFSFYRKTTYLSENLTIDGTALWSSISYIQELLAFTNRKYFLYQMSFRFYIVLLVNLTCLYMNSLKTTSQAFHELRGLFAIICFLTNASHINFYISWFISHWRLILKQPSPKVIYHTYLTLLQFRPFSSTDDVWRLSCTP